MLDQKYGDDLQRQAEATWEAAYLQGYEVILSKIIHLSQVYLNHERRPLKSEFGGRS